MLGLSRCACGVSWACMICAPLHQSMSCAPPLHHMMVLPHHDCRQICLRRFYLFRAALSLSHVNMCVNLGRQMIGRQHRSFWEECSAATGLLSSTTFFLPFFFPSFFPSVPPSSLPSWALIPISLCVGGICIFFLSPSFIIKRYHSPTHT